MKKKPEVTRIEDGDAPERAGRGGLAITSGSRSEDARADESGRAAVPECAPSSLLSEISLEVRVELGRTRMPLGDALRLASGSVVDLERLVDEPVDLYVNDILVARGEIVVVNESFCVRITEVTPAAAEVSR